MIHELIENLLTRSRGHYIELECGLITSMKFAPKMTDKPIYTLTELVNNGVINTIKAPKYYKLWRNED